MKLNNKNFLISAIYRPRSKHENIEEFMREINPILNSSIFKRSNSILIGDININLLDHVVDKPTNDFLNMMQTFNYLPLITRPTRFAEGNQIASPSLLDHIYVNFTSPLVAGILHHKITDHLPIYLHLNTPNISSTLHTINFRVFSEYSKQMFTRALTNVFWEELLIHENVNDNFDVFFQTFENLYDTHFPIKTKKVTHKRVSNPWITSGILTSIRNKNKIYKDMKLGLITPETFRLYRNNFNNIIRFAKQNYYKNLFSSFRYNTKKLWQAVNKLTKKSVCRTNKITIVNNNKIITDPKIVANEFNNFFTNIASELDSKLPTSEIDPMTYLTGYFENPMPNPTTSLSDIIKVIKSLKSKPCRTNDFSTVIIKENSHLIASPLHLLFNQSLIQGIFPTQLKKASIIPLYKKGDTNDMGNYRPIALLNIFSKNFEKIMKKIWLISYQQTIYFH